MLYLRRCRKILFRSHPDGFQAGLCSSLDAHPAWLGCGRQFLGLTTQVVDRCRGVAKLVKALDFDSSMRRFESFLPCQARCTAWPFDVQALSKFTGWTKHAGSSQPPDFMVFTGNANPGMAADIADHLGISLGSATVGRFSDGEVTVEINQNVRARDVFVVQSTCAPTNENLMELLIMVDALKRASAERIGAVIPLFRLRPARPPSPIHPRPHHRQGSGQHAASCRCCAS